MPDPLILKNGEKIKTPEEWLEKRRLEIVEDFDREIYGRVPDNIAPVTWKVGMFLGGVHAGPVYKLLEKKDLGATEFPPLDTALIDGEIAFRQHEGGHTTGPNWTTWIAWASRYWGD